MSNEDKIVDLLGQLVIRADRHEMLLEKLVEGQFRHEQLLREHSVKLDEHSVKLDEHARILNIHTRILEEHTQILNRHSEKFDDHDQRLQNLERLSTRQEALLERILELLAEDVIRAEEILDAEYFDDGKRVVFHKSKYAPNF